MKIISLENLKTFYNNSKKFLGNMTNITYAELKTLRDNSQLVEGQYYRITDFVTTVDQEDAKSAGHRFDIIVLAASSNTLNENALAAKHAEDTYFDNSNLDAWKLKYDLDNDKSKYAWADETNGKGIIYRMIDEWNNDIPYDFKNIQFARDWSVIAPDSGLSGTVYCYTFSVFLDGFSEDTIANDESIKAKECIESDGEGIFGNNTIRIHQNNGISLNNIIFVTDWSSYIVYHYSNSFGGNCFNNSFGGNCFNNTFGRNCFNNTFGADCYNNTFGVDCYNNTFGRDCYNNTFGGYCFNNTFGVDCYNNTFGGICYRNTFGVDCYQNTFGGDCYRNTFGVDCYQNTFGGDCSENTFGNYYYHNTFNSDARKISFELYTTGSSMKIQYLTVYQVSSTIIPADLITLNANYSQVLWLNSSGELVCKPVLVTKDNIGLGNVDNTSDLNKPISIATQTALDKKANKATTLAGYGITDAKIDNNGTITLGTVSIEVMTNDEINAMFV